MDLFSKGLPQTSANALSRDSRGQGTQPTRYLTLHPQESAQKDEQTQTKFALLWTHASLHALSIPAISFSGSCHTAFRIMSPATSIQILEGLTLMRNTLSPDTQVSERLRPQSCLDSLWGPRESCIITLTEPPCPECRDRCFQGVLGETMAPHHWAEPWAPRACGVVTVSKSTGEVI